MLPNQYTPKKHQRWRLCDNRIHTQGCFNAKTCCQVVIISSRRLESLWHSFCYVTNMAFFFQKYVRFTKHRLLIKIYRITSVHWHVSPSLCGPDPADYSIPHYERQMFCQCKHLPPYLSEAAERFVSVWWWVCWEWGGWCVRGSHSSLVTFLCHCMCAA